MKKKTKKKEMKNNALRATDNFIFLRKCFVEQPSELRSISACMQTFVEFYHVEIASTSELSFYVLCSKKKT